MKILPLSLSLVSWELGFLELEVCAPAILPVYSSKAKELHKFNFLKFS